MNETFIKYLSQCCDKMACPPETCMIAQNAGEDTNTHKNFSTKKKELFFGFLSKKNHKENFFGFGWCVQQK